MEDVVTYSSLHALLDDQLQEMYAAEHDLVRRLPLLAEGASSTELKHCIQGHLEDTEKQLDRLEHILKARGVPLRGKTPRAIDALVRQGLEIVERRSNETLMDLGLIFVLRHIEDVERGSYEIARSIAEVVDCPDIIQTLDRSRDEEDQMERSLTVLCDDMIDSVAAEMSAIGKEKFSGTGAPTL
jgi:ferritin-like metal-binding protein YciE